MWGYYIYPLPREELVNMPNSFSTFPRKRKMPELLRVPSPDDKLNVMGKADLCMHVWWACLHSWEWVRTPQKSETASKLYHIQ